MADLTHIALPDETALRPILPMHLAVFYGGGHPLAVA
jgi:hypothetical protein